MNTEWDELILSYLSEHIGADDLVKLERELRQNEKVQLRFVELAEQEVDLRDVLQGMDLQKSSREDVLKRQWPIKRALPLAVAACILLVFGLFLFDGASRVKPSELSTLRVVDGSAIQKKSGQELWLKEGDLLVFGARIQTAENQSLVLGYDNESTKIEVTTNTEFRLGQTEGGGKVIHLTKGLLKATVAKQPEDRPMRISTQQCEVTILGTVLKVSSDTAETQVEVLEGLVEVNSSLEEKGVFVSGKELYVINLEDEVSSLRASVLAEDEKAEAPFFPKIGMPKDTPEQAKLREELDGKGYLYMPVGNKLFRLSPDGRDKKIIWQSSKKKDYISWTQVSWDGKWVAVVVLSNINGRGNQGLWLLRHDGSEAQEVFKNKVGNHLTRISCAWSPDNSWLVMAYGGQVSGLNLQTREVKEVFKAGGEGTGVTYLSSDLLGNYYFWGYGIDKGDSFTLDKNCRIIKTLNKCGMRTSCQPSVSPDGNMMARHGHDYEENSGRKRGFVSHRPGLGKKQEWRYVPETKDWGSRGVHNSPFWSDDGAYLGYVYIPDEKELETVGYRLEKNSAILVICRSGLSGGPMVWVTLGADKGSSCSWGPVPK